MRKKIKKGNALNSTLKAGKGFKRQLNLIRPSRIKQVSKKRAKELAEYYVLRDMYLKEHPICEACEKKPSTQIHHKMKRFGKYLCDVRYFMAVDNECHRWIEDHQSKAEEKGWIIRRSNEK